MKNILLSLSLATSALAPYQCAREPAPDRRTEDSAPEALYRLAIHFHERGDQDACRETLRHLIERYPESRYARRAEEALRGQGPPPALHLDTPTHRER